MSFTAPANDGGAVITGYTVSCVSSDGGDPGAAFEVSGPISVPGLTIGRTYQCSVKAVNAIGPSVPSGASNVFVAATVPDPPMNVLASRGNASAWVSFTAPVNDGGSPITGYTVSCVSSDGGAPGSASSAAALILVSGLTNGHTYQCTATATSAVGPSVASGTSNGFVPATVPGAPGSPLAVPYGGAGAKVSWSPPPNGGSPITGYVIVASPGGTTVSVSSSTTSATFSNLAPSSYEFRRTGVERDR